jgi:hypothetical protein
VKRKNSIILPSVIPVRFPAGEELAAAMRALPVMRLARALAGWLGDEPIPIADGWQAPETRLDAARALGLVAEDGTLTDEITRRLNWIYEIAFHAGYLHTEHGTVHRHQGLDTATEQTDAQIRTAWDGALNALFAHGVEDLLPEAANPAPLDFHGIGNFPLLAMLEQHGTATVTELSDEIALGATEGMTPSAAEHAWAAWTSKHGDPTRGYLGLAEELGVLKIDGETATLTPLGTWAMLRQLHNAHLEHLPDSAELTPYQVLVCRLGMSDEAFGRDLECWLTAREPGSAVTELLTEAAAQSDSPLYLRTGVQIAAGISGDTDEAWREALAMPEVRPYAAAELNRRAGHDFWDNPLPGLEPIHCDSAVMASHGIIAAYEGSKDPAEVASAVREEASRTSEAAMFEEMWRSRHQVAYQALAVIGQHHPDKKTAKAARATLHKASSARLPTAPHGPSSPALKADGLRQHVRSVLQVREAPGQRRDSQANLLSRSRIKNLNRPARSPRSISKLRACCAVHAPDGCAVTPRICTARVWISSTTSTYRRCSSTVSACKKSHARMPDAGAARNCRHVGDERRGAGPSPAAARIRRIVPSPTRYPRPTSSLWIRR